MIKLFFLTLISKSHIDPFWKKLSLSAGCQLSASVSKEVTGYTGGSVLLPCSCTDPQSTVKFTWLKLNGRHRNEVFKNESFKGRLKLFNENSPENLSLLISDLRKKDEGLYRCEISHTNYKDIQVKIKGKWNIFIWNPYFSKCSIYFLLSVKCSVNVNVSNCCECVVRVWSGSE